MKQRIIQSKKGRSSHITPPLLLLLLLVMTACGQAGTSPLATAGTATASPPDLTPTTAATATGVPLAPTLTAYAAATLTVSELGAEIRSMGATAEAANTRAALTTVPLEQTELARPSPTLYTFPTARGTSVPASTPVIGLQPPEHCVPMVHGFEQTNQSNCWIVLLNNEYLYVDAGYLYNVSSGDLNDETIGAIIIFGGAGPTAFYQTPQRLGPVYIVSVDGTQVHLALDGHPPTAIAFVFDLATRQWVAGTPEPSPIPSLLPSPSAGP